MALLMGLDIGSTSIKANIYNEKGSLISSGSRPTILSHPDKEHSNWAIWHPEDIWNGRGSHRQKWKMALPLYFLALSQNRAAKQNVESESRSR